jgi:aspartyl-tRNA(Asn)/glutamyl-tRNA(Gln) amidotransferase subunit C
MTKKINLSPKDFSNLAALSHLSPTKEESDTIRNQLSESLNAMDVLNELDTKDVPPLNHPTGDMTNVFREDEVTPSLSQQEALSNARSTHNGFFQVDAIFESQES